MPEDSFVVEQVVAAVGLCFRKGGKVYYFLPNDFPVDLEDFVVVETDKGVDIGEVVEVLHRLRPEDARPTKQVLRPANSADVRRKKQLFAKEERALRICAEKLADSNLPMKLIEASYTLDGKRLTFTFVSESRVDFRDLVRDLARTFRCRIELRQVGVRDQARAIGGLGPCGRPLCCATFLRDFMSVGIRLAKDQGLSMNPAKLSGNCDRLMCCLRYEHAQYTEMAKRLPKAEAYVETPEARGEVVERNLLVGAVRLRDEAGNMAVVSWEALEAAGQLRAAGPATTPKQAPKACPHREECPREQPCAPPAETAPVEESAPAEGEQPTEAPGEPGRRRRRRGRRGGRKREGAEGASPAAGEDPPRPATQADPP